jgi:DNA repair protein RadA/Sms
MAKARAIYTCGNCGSQQPKWQGQCPDCGAWNTLSESVAVPKRAERTQYTGQIEFTRLDRVDVSTVDRLTTGLGEFDRVLGGGLVPGGVVLLGGDPGIGKSTLLLRALANLAPRLSTCYVTGEESLEQIGLRARRLGVGEAPLDMLAETCVEAVLAHPRRQGAHAARPAGT